ncbi:phosphatase [Leptolyngbya iicbica LK]|uniref:Phosphatase n=2 Tax=Cyanophyceae TaxID=3028117 RepID=A0A4Q7EGL6_9CYAN|nr:phosphatase [Leptolyngbya sp. LK]
MTDIYNYLPISERLATAGQPTAEQFAAIAQADFAVVINLALPTSTNALPDECAVVEAQGMTYYPIPVEWEYPTLRDFQQFATVMAQHAEQKVFVHCAMNMRVSTFVYLYRCLRGVPRDTAAADLAKIWQPNETWQNFIDTVLPE